MTPIDAPLPDLVTAEAMERFETAQFCKRGTTRITTFTLPPGTPYQTPEGLKAEDEPTRCAWDTQGGVYPIRESVFQESYLPASGEDEPSSGTEPIGVYVRRLAVEEPCKRRWPTARKEYRG